MYNNVYSENFEKSENNENSGDILFYSVYESQSKNSGDMILDCDALNKNCFNRNNVKYDKTYFIESNEKCNGNVSKFRRVIFKMNEKYIKNMLSMIEKDIKNIYGDKSKIKEIKFLDYKLEKELESIMLMKRMEIKNDFILSAIKENIASYLDSYNYICKIINNEEEYDKTLKTNKMSIVEIELRKIDEKNVRIIKQALSNKTSIKNKILSMFNKSLSMFNKSLKEMEYMRNYHIIITI